MIAVPRVVVSAPSSGHGKTAIAVGLLAALAARGLKAAGFKVGPDHTDAAYLGMAAGRLGRNLDPRLVGAQRVAPLFAHGTADADVAVVEGTMGLFDSLAGRPETESTAAIATSLRAPVVLIIDVGAMGQSVAALAHGFRAYDEMLWLGGVILNRVASDRHEQLLRDALDDIGVPVFGALRRRDLPAVLPSRQHGVVPVMQRGVEAYRGIRRLGEAVAGGVDLDRLLALARSAPRVPVDVWSAPEAVGEPGQPAPGAEARGRRPLIALAGGPALSYSYAETAELLVAAGAEVVTVDPLRDEALPKGADALVIGGALPETYAEELSANRRLCIAVAELARTGRPVIAEGAGLLWLAREFDGRPMCGVLDATGTSLERTVVGYREATARADTPVAQVGARVVGYKQHRGVLSPRAGQTPAWTWGGGPPEGFVWRRVHASQLMVHWASSPGIARRLVAAALSVPPARPAAPAGAPAGGTGAPPSAQTGGTAPAGTSAAPGVAVPAVPVASSAAERPTPPGPGRPGSERPASDPSVPDRPAPDRPAPISPAAGGVVPISPAGPDRTVPVSSAVLASPVGASPVSPAGPIRPDRPAPVSPARSRPDRPPVPPAGSRPDRPAPVSPAGSRPDRPAPVSPAGSRSDRPPVSPAGSRPDRPPVSPAGSRPDRPAPVSPGGPPGGPAPHPSAGPATSGPATSGPAAPGRPGMAPPSPMAPPPGQPVMAPPPHMGPQPGQPSAVPPAVRPAPVLPADQPPAAVPPASRPPAAQPAPGQPPLTMREPSADGESAE
ncbi:cobyrinate a,c-diamide synthase [Plantactinospora sonchi]|uniref:Cobyrinate a,c-diamide synthase n=1 Tax=Plantactinospora sonchi TaxID=1544735 RepID=A0ABU7S1N9_9ACTN